MTCPEIKSLLKESIGLHAEAVGDSSIERAVRQRMTTLAIASENEFLARLKSDTSELAELIEEVVVSETWFFRNIIPFEALAKLLPELLENNPNRFLHILSIPCSSGEEPYSIAITLLECASLEKFDFVVDSFDVSKRAIAKAKRAVYGNYSFREGEGVEAIKEKYFVKEKNGYHLKPDVKRYVNAAQGNVLTDNIAPSAGYYDVIFCRNLLIYFDRETQARVLGKLGDILKPSGLLFLGHAESSQAVTELYSRVNIPKAFAYQKKAAKPISTMGDRVSANIKTLEAAYQQLMKSLPQRDAAKNSGNDKAKRSPTTKKKQVTTNKDRQSGRRAAVMHHIEMGRLQEAATECEHYLQENPESSEAYYLLGLINHLQGQGTAAEAFLKKSMYLDPNHHGALALSAMLAEKRGDAEIAQTLRRREQRVLKRKSSKNNGN